MLRNKSKLPDFCSFRRVEHKEQWQSANHCSSALEVELTLPIAATFICIYLRNSFYLNKSYIRQTVFACYSQRLSNLA